MQLLLHLECFLYAVGSPFTFSCPERQYLIGITDNIGVAYHSCRPAIFIPIRKEESTGNLPKQCPFLCYSVCPFCPSTDDYHISCKVSIPFSQLVPDHLFVCPSSGTDYGDFHSFSFQ